MAEPDRTTETRFDWKREQRCGLPEVIFAEGKSVEQLAAVSRAIALRLRADANAQPRGVLLSRLSAEKYRALLEAENWSLEWDYDAISRTAFFGSSGHTAQAVPIALLCAGTSDLPVAREALRALEWFGYRAKLFCDVGVAGLWRILELREELRRYQVLIVAAGMEGALFSVIGGLVPGLVIALPTSVGYGVCEGGKVALAASLATCAPGVVSVNIDNGIGAAAAACKVMGRRVEKSVRRKGASNTIQQNERAP